jgi:hypothetical protein
MRQLMPRLPAAGLLNKKIGANVQRVANTEDCARAIAAHPASRSVYSAVASSNPAAILVIQKIGANVRDQKVGANVRGFQLILLPEEPSFRNR